jgi:hypothetical protein
MFHFANHLNRDGFSTGRAARSLQNSSYERQRRQSMKKLALILSAFGLVVFAGVSRADDVKSENSSKTETGTTISGKKKVTKTEKVTTPDGTTTETKSETVMPKTEEHKDVAEKRDTDEGATVKTEHHTTLTGKKETKKTKKVENADGSETTTTKTVTEPKK